MNSTQKRVVLEAIALEKSGVGPSESGVACLHPSLVVAGVSLLTDEQAMQLLATLEHVNMDEVAQRTTAFLLREIGADKLTAQWERLKSDPELYS